jgi:guanylate kinase
VGKSTVVGPILERQPDLAFSVSWTTRPPRPGEQDGKHYRFVTDETFRRLIEEGGFLEWAEVFGHRYGTPMAPIAEEMAGSRAVLLEIDVQGAASVRAKMPDAVLIFLAPPTEHELARRLGARRTEDRAERDRRLSRAKEEMGQASWFDHVVVNDDISRAAGEVAGIIDGHRGGQAGRTHA